MTITYPYQTYTFNAKLVLDYMSGNAYDPDMPAYSYTGDLSANTEAAYNALVWTDPRPKPTWAELVGNTSAQYFYTHLNYRDFIYGDWWLEQELKKKATIRRGSANAVLNGVEELLRKVTTDVNGIAEIHLTDDGTSTGNALWTTVLDEALKIEINSNAISPRWSWEISTDKKKLTITVTKSNSFSVLGLTLLGLPNVPANAVELNVSIKGKA